MSLPKDILTLDELTKEEIEDIFLLTDKLKRYPRRYSGVLKGKTLVLIFQKPSNRTRVSFEVGMYQLGGSAIYLSSQEINLGVREAIKDVARTLSRYADAIALRTFAHQTVEEMARYATIPVINGLSDFAHPCQALADIYTVRQKSKRYPHVSIAYIGDGNNVCNSLITICNKLGIQIRVATPLSYQPQVKIKKGMLSCIPAEVAKEADVLYTDVWASMGQEAEYEKRKQDFAGFQINKQILKLAKKDVLVMHCLPAHRGEEITDEVMESAQSVVFDQAENRLHVQKALLLKLLKQRRK